jgi:polysaccharide export outer membrane protein
MIPRVLPGMLLAAFLMTFSTGCYDRWTGNYSELQELDGKHDAVLERAELTPEEREKRRNILIEAAKLKKSVYTINGGDKLEIRVYNHPDLSVKTVVTPDGMVGLVLIGEIKIAGLTLGQASQKIADALSKYIRNPKVGISPFEIASETVSIAGSVSHSGIYVIFDGMRLADLFAKAGGTATRYLDGQTIDAADLDHSVFIRDNKILPVDFPEAIERGNPLHNLELRRGDYVYIATREDSMVFITGAVKSPGRHVWTRKKGLLEHLTESGWVQETHWKNVIIIRGGLANPTMYKVDLDGIVRGERPNVALKSGDIIYVPHDNISEYNVFIRKLIPTAQLINMMLTPATWMSSHF